MAEKRSILSEENQPTVIAVTFVLALLATGIGVYDLLQLRGQAMLVQRINNVNVESINTQLSAATTKFADLEKRLAEIEQKSAAMTVAAAPGAAPAAAAPDGKAGKSKTP